MNQNAMAADDVITGEEVKALFTGDKLNLDALKQLLSQKRDMKVDKWDTYVDFKDISESSTQADLDVALKSVEAKHKEEKDRLIKDEMAIAVKLGYCGMFTIYCCLCTAFTSCCIGPYFSANYMKEMEERKEKYDADLEKRYQGGEMQR